ncbi:hypothetical protein DFQ27_002369 [Actinomortierella ambigua]|uniref:F-box domain-containing protein n=1 Tax=Actinomortierella ambigua TaxID=1343610 RepID=A0A9P6U744_9FUNG|nr:hypothetical protein DFQ27_002369 [Actinomortierella ambigua]
MNAFSIPEILMAVGHHLTLHELTVCARVNKLWQATLSPLLYREVHRTALERGLVVTPMVAPFIRKLKVAHESPGMETLVQHCQDLVSVHMTSLQSAQDWQCLLRLVERNLRLRALTIEFSPWGLDLDWSALVAAFSPRPSSSTLPSSSSSVRQSTISELSIQDHYNLFRGPQVLALFDALPALRVFRFNGRSCEEARFRWLMHARKRRNKQLQQECSAEKRTHQQRQLSLKRTTFGLRVLEVTESSNRLAMTLLEFLPKLEILRMTSNAVDMDEFPASMATICPKLHTLEILHRLRVHIQYPTIDSASDDPFVNTVNAERAMRGVQGCRPHSLIKVILAEAYTGGLIIQTLLEHQCRSLQVLRLIMSRPSVTSHHLQQLLTMCPELRDLTVIGFAIENRLTLRDAVREPWVCTKIECLRIAMRCYLFGEEELLPSQHHHSLDEQGLLHPQHHQHPVACRTLEQQFYKQLGQLEHLQYLHITGRPPLEGRFLSTTKHALLSDTLSWSLDRGLGAMAGRPGAGQRLQTLNMGLGDHWMGLAEIQWMHQHFPKLTRITGLSHSRSRQRDQAEAWVRQHWPGVELE